MTLPSRLHLVDDLGHQAVDDAVVAAGAVMELLVGQQLGLFKQIQPSYLPSFMLRIFSTISSVVGIWLPQ